MTPAQTHLQERERQLPPRSRVDRTRQLYSIIEPDLPAELRAIYATGQLALAEIPDSTPNAFTTPLENGNFAVEFNTGLMEFIYAVSRTLAGSVNVFLGDGKVIKRVLPHEEIVRLIKTVFDQWKSGALLKGQMAQAPSMLLHPEQIHIAEDTATKAELFILAHELGHVSMDMDFVKGPTGDEELDADIFATNVILRAGQRWSLRMTYAGAMFAIRIFSGLEKVGYKFPGNYPAPEVRLKNLKQWTQTFLQNPEVFQQISTIAVSFDELMEAVENVLLDKPAATLQTPERVCARLSVVIDECARGMLTNENALSDANNALKDVSGDVLAEAAKSLSHLYYPQPGPTGQDETARDWQVKRVKALEWLVSNIPGPARTVFLQVMPIGKMMNTVKPTKE